MTPAQRRSYRRGHRGPKCAACVREKPFHVRLATQPANEPRLCVLHASRERKAAA